MKNLKIFIKKILNKIKRIIRGGLFRLNSFSSKIQKKIKAKSKVNMNFYNNIDNLIYNIPKSSKSSYYNKIDIKVGIITDEYMYNYYKDAVNLIYISYSDYEKVIKKVDIVLYVSCWHGMNNNDWRGITSESGKEKIINVLNYAKRCNKKVIFQTIEDPSNYETYLPIAKHADYIFTTASEMIERYKIDTNNENVFFLDYGINPMFHNPVGFMNDNKLDDVFFAGSWAPRYRERCEDASILFDGVIKSSKNLIIADRNCNIKGYEFPVKYDSYIIPAIEHKKLQQVHKLFNWSINLNSIKYSPTMCAMRVYELQAIGNLLISNYSIAVNNKFPNIFIVKYSDDVLSIIDGYSKLDVYKMQVDGIRNVMSNHTVYDKLNYIFDCINEKKYKMSEKKVLVVCQELSNKIKKMYESQTFKNKDIIEFNNLNRSILKKYVYVSFMKESIDYGKHYLEDLVNAFKYTASDFISISSNIENGSLVGINHDYIEGCDEIGLSIFSTKKYDAIKTIKNGVLKGKGYSIDPFQIAKIKYDDFEKAVLSVIVPVYNNGKFLLYKCFLSLVRSSLFKKMEIILVDDGSTDDETVDIVKELADTYSNVKTYFYNDGGSGSASRARNKGLELATTNYITYLDPDNEAINDGYNKLYNIISNNNYDFVFGGIVKLSDKESIFSYYSENKIISNPREELINKNFKTNSVQACIIKKELILNFNIYNPEGAIGQDSFFFQELMLNAKIAYYLNLPIHIYYAARNESVVNSLNHKFFEKSLIMEEYQVEKLKEYGLLKVYKDKRFKNFLENWYYEKLKLVKSKIEIEKSKKIIKKMEELYK